MYSMSTRTGSIAARLVDSGSVNQVALRSMQRDWGNKVIASCSLLGRDQCRRILNLTGVALAPEPFDQCIEQTAFTDIRRPDECDSHGLTRNVPRVHLLFHIVEQSFSRCKSLAQLR